MRMAASPIAKAGTTCRSPPWQSSSGWIHDVWQYYLTHHSWKDQVASASSTCPTRAKEYHSVRPPTGPIVSHLLHSQPESEGSGSSRGVRPVTTRDVGDRTLPEHVLHALVWLGILHRVTMFWRPHRPQLPALCGHGYGIAGPILNFHTTF